MTEQEMLREVARQDYEAQSAEALARIQYQVDYSKTLLNGLMIGNGGAILAILTFIGNTGSKVEPSRMMWAFSLYAAGLACVFIAYAGAFFSQFFYYSASQNQAWLAQAEALGAKRDVTIDKDVSRGNKAMICGVSAAILSLTAFIAGSVSALRALT